MRELVIDPKEDGITHINTYTRGKTRLGRLATNLADVQTNHPKYGIFRTAEGLWYYIKTGCKHEELRALNGFQAKRLGVTLPVVWNPDFREEFKEGLKAKILGHPELLRLFVESTLPFKHYYYYESKKEGVPPKVIVPRDAEWMMEYLNELRKELKKARANT